MTRQTDVDIPETGAIFTFGRTSFANNVPSKFWLKNDHPKHMSCGGEHSAVITENGRLLMFGGNTWGQLGLRIKPSARKPTSVKALKSEKVKLAACGRDHTIVCTFHGSVYSAGSNQDGQLGLGHCDKSTYFHLLRPFCDWAPIKMLSAGCNTSAALTEDGRLFMWGDNSVGQIAFGDEGFAAEPREVHVGEAVIWVSCGYKHSAFVTVYGRLYTFGESANGRLGLQKEQLANHRVPQQVQGVLGHVTRVCCGGEHTVVLTEKNVYTFGRGQYGQLGHGTFLFEVHLPKALQHFCNSKVRHIACGENHTAVVTDSGLLYTFGDGRHGKLGLGEENFINQFSPTLCTRFLQYAVQSVSCGGHHMLVLATPRPAESQEVVPEKDVLITDDFLESSFTKIIFKNKFINPTPPSPLSALSARARHRDRVRSVELFGDKFQSLPRLNSDFLNTSRQTSRNSLTLKTLSKDATTPSSSPKPKSEVAGSPLLSPRSRSISPQSPLISSKASSPHSQSSFTLQSKASTSASSKSKCKKVPSPLLLPKSITKLNPSSPVATKMTAKPRLNRAAAPKKPLSNKFSSPVPPKEPYTPTRPPSNVFIKNLKEEEHPAPTQTENVKRQIITGEVEEKEDSDFSPYMEKKKGRAFRHGVKEAEAFAQQIQTNEKTDRNSHKVLPTELMKGPSTLKTEVSHLKSTKKNHKVTSNSKENITKESSDIKPSENRQAQKQLPHFKSPQQDKRKPSEYSTKTQQTLTDAPGRVTEVKHKTRKTEDLRESNKPNEEDNSSLKKGLTRTPRKETKKSVSLDQKSPSIKVSKVNQAANLASTENAVKENEATQRGSDDVKPVEVASRGTRRVKSTLTKDQHKVKSVPGKGNSAAVDAKSPATQEGNTTPFKAETKKSVSRKTPLKVKGKLQELKPTPVRDQSKCAENPLIEGESKEKCEENELNCAKDATLKMKGGTVDEQKLSKIKDKKMAKESGAEQRAKTKRRGGGKEEEIRVKDEDVDSENKMKAKPKSEASSLLSSQQDTPTEVRGNPISPQSPEVDSLRAAKPLQGAEPVGMDSRVSETDEEDTRGKNGEKTNWGEILSNSASLLPAAGIAGAAIEVLRQAVTSVQSDSDKATSTPSKTLSNVRQFTKQSAVTEPSLSSTLSHFSSSNETEDGPKTDAQAGVPSESVNESQEGENDDSSRDPSEGEAVKGGLSEQIRGEHMEDSQKEVEEKSEKESGEDEDSEDGGKNEDEDVESGSDSEDKREESESSSDKETGEESNTGEGEEDNVSEEEEGEEKTSRSDEDEGSDKTNAAETEGEEESSKKTSDGLSDSDVSEGAEEEEEEGENEESSDEESKEDKEEESKMSEDEEKKSGDESESDESTSRESEEGEEDGEEGDTAESAKTEEEENDEDEEGETEEHNDASTENEDEEKDSVEDEEADKSEGEQDSDKGEEEGDSGADEEELQDEKSDEEEEEGGEEREERESVGDGEAETEAGEDEDKEESEEEEESAEEEEKEEEDTGDEDTEAEEEEEEKEEDAGDEDTKAEEEEEEKEEDTGDEETEAEEEEEEKEEDTGDEETEAEEEEEEKEEDTEDEDIEAEEEEEEKEDIGDEEKEAEEDVTEEEDEEENESEEEEKPKGKNKSMEPAKKNLLESDEGEGEEEEGEGEGEEEGEEEEEQQKQTRLRGERKDMKGNDEETDDEEEREEENKERGNENQEEEEAEEEGIEEEEEGDENEEEEGEDEEEEEEEEEQAKSAKKIKEKRQKPPPDRSDKQKEAPKPAPRTRQRAAGEAKAEESQQFWNDVLPQYLDLQ
ncbi:X-linked retinitis pigmentosa GTPase regulator isoform X1 [Oreochromis niloticus]|uniref:X-linked retinitis pigmentosa GTPase regulator isoform X1 n=1 Tax=Oreochromis niloticus TaxID=8128 RepID=UPI0009056007|nr:X-linked retinitis pigmentosa GTPase regulator isoform X1 [Oreochromis niloticus]XP_025759791.1 X-linked retinitis pigmentosa GTPase regulator isoform X1 [Oreochromis niloticus]